MRVIAGSARGRRLTVPRGRDTRPTSDRVKEALFSSLQPRLPGAHVADLYAGGGGLGIEALSRGASAVTFVERATHAHRALLENLHRTGLGEDSIVLHGDVATLLEAGLPGAPFDLVLLDPPYALSGTELQHVLERVITIVSDGGLVVVERGRRSDPLRWPRGLPPGRARRYGDTILYEARPAGASGTTTEEGGAP
ncbi:MAG TPA: 16S rRNA (guanine(966)-N(2))-methyltransferase RsmD [Nitriliruptorales bacterium]|nr:16S rRNA (guanine(966)-N(2))-methyltransferase RsmD [Nitriliruptorales bacterium]